LKLNRVWYHLRLHSDMTVNCELKNWKLRWYLLAAWLHFTKTDDKARIWYHCGAPGIDMNQQNTN
jgi:hypothetical protein